MKVITTLSYTIINKIRYNYKNNSKLKRYD